MSLTTCQENAVTEFTKFILDSNQQEFILTGSGGTGKTHLIADFINVLDKQKSLYDLGLSTYAINNTLLIAPTHKAAKILSDKTNKDVFTIHSALNLKRFFDPDTGDEIFKPDPKKQPVKFRSTLIIIDEASMIDSYLLDLFKDALDDKSKVLYLGDEFQLSPVNESYSPIFKLHVNSVELTSLVRFSDKELSDLVIACREAVRTNTYPKLINNNKNIQLYNKNEFIRNALQDFKANNDTVILAWTNKKVKEYSSIVHKSLYQNTPYNVGQSLIVNKPFNSTTNLLSTESTLFIQEILGSESEKINGVLLEYLRIRTDKGIINICDTPKLLIKALKPYKENKDWYSFYNTREKFANVRNSYSTTIHKSQGSTYHTVYIDLPDLMRNPKRNELLRLLYVAISRASHKIVFLKE